MYNCLIVDDNMIERDLLSMYLSKIKNLEIVATCSDGLEAAAALKEQEVDLVFSDIDMPELSGIGLIKSLAKPPVFIFISSYSEYAAESFNLDVIDYIVKPASFDRLFKAVNKAIEYIELKRKIPSVLPEMPIASGNINEIGSTLATDEYFFIKDNNGFTKIDVADVVYIESMGDFSKIHTLKNKKHIILVSLKNIERQVSQNIFRRIHKQYIVNLQHIVSINATDIYVSDNQVIPLSGLYKQALLESVVEKNLLKRFGE